MTDKESIKIYNAKLFYLDNIPLPSIIIKSHLNRGRSRPYSGRGALRGK